MRRKRARERLFSRVEKIAHFLSFFVENRQMICEPEKLKNLKLTNLYYYFKLLIEAI